MKRGSYKLYNKDTTLPLPKMTAWRRRKEAEENILATYKNSIDEEGIDHYCYQLVNKALSKIHTCMHACMCLNDIVMQN